MPFHQRTIEPRRVARLSARDGWTPREEPGTRKLRRPVLFSSLDEVGCHTLTNMIYQLSDLSRHASDIFLAIEMEAGMVFRRSCRIQGRLQKLQVEIRKLDAKKTKIHLQRTCVRADDPDLITERGTEEPSDEPTGHAASPGQQLSRADSIHVTIATLGFRGHRRHTKTGSRLRGRETARLEEEEEGQLTGHLDPEGGRHLDFFHNIELPGFFLSRW
ncbi:Wiskott-Aldrich syndrome protein family member 3 [Liparis tanakae]|uniref:Wiskott-Aldrich syndrome protein family member 3 n=1 Tax=Liparis tanakae TaxID=230148 RepID=A0A4Z2HSW2_9TELE|nr:Wiskott-Aldrich syndrome protein family member 3 [Liparis tanakae]